MPEQLSDYEQDKAACRAKIVANAEAASGKTLDKMTAADFDAVPLKETSSAGQALHSKIYHEVVVQERLAALVMQMKMRYAEWEAAKFPADEVIELSGLAIGLKE